MRRRQLLVQGGRAVFHAPFLPLVAQAQGRQSLDASIRALEKQIPDLMQGALVPGVSIAIIENARVRWRRGFGVKDSESKVPVDDSTMFEAASMSKPVFAYAVLKLCEKGVISLDTPLTRYMPERLLNGDARLDLITARHALSHTTGLPDWRSEKDPLKIHFTPGEKYAYSGEGYNYLQSVVTHLTGRVNRKECGKYESGLEVCATDIDGYMKANLLGPFGMTSSGYVWNGMCDKRMARPHDRKGQPLNNRKTSSIDAARYAAAGALLTTPTDYAKFLIEIIDPKANDRFRLNRGSLKEMLRPQIKVEANDEYSISWSLGWRLAHTKEGDFFGHGGDNVGFHCFAQGSVARKSGFVIMTNGENGVDVLKKLAPTVVRMLHS